MSEPTTTIGHGRTGARTRRAAAAWLAALSVLGSAPAGAEVPSLIGYQGSVFDAAGNPAAGPVTIGVALYDAESGGQQVYAETHASVALVDGVFDLQIGAGASPVGSLGATALAGPTWLELTIDGERLDPRQRLVAVPYAMRAAVAERIEGELGTTDVAITGSGSQLDGAPLVVENTNTTDGVAATMSSDSGWPTAYFENHGDGEVVKIYGRGTGVEDAALRVENLLSADAWTGWFRGRTRFENTLTGGYSDGRLRAVEVIGNGSWTANPALYVANQSTNHGIAARFINSSAYASTYHSNSGSGIGISVSNQGATRDNAAIRANNSNPDRGMAGYFTNSSNYATAHFRNAGSGQVLYLQNDGTGHFLQGVDPNEGTRFWIDGTGMAHVRALEILGGADLSERFDVAATPDAPVEPGTVVAIDPEKPEGRLIPSRGAYSRTVAGIVAGAGGIEPGMLMAQKGVSAVDGAHPVALTGRVYAKADTSNGPIRPGDLLTTSERPGHAMKASDWQRSQGAVLGKALGSLDGETGLVLVLVGLQ